MPNPSLGLAGFLSGSVRKVWMLENYWDWRQSACHLGEADYSGLDMLNVKMIQTGSQGQATYIAKD